ncbi:MAG: acyl-CoA carboxylase subunit beta [Phycisphaerales bacterium]|nr:acyl-CoA carboxylase subunit beta [Phycisphaerales bacterium]
MLTRTKDTRAADDALRQAMEAFERQAAEIRLGGGHKAIERQHERGRLTARERIELLVDRPGRGNGQFVELGLFAAWGMYREYGGAPAAGVVTGIGPVDGRLCMIIANDATVKAGAFFPMTCKKIIRAQMIARQARLPLIYLVDSAGVFLPLQEDVFPDTDDFGRIFRNNAVISAEGIVQMAAIMGNCVAGGGYLPVLCDTLLMTDGSGLYLAGPALVKAAIGQNVDHESLGGAEMHAAVSGTIDYHEKTDEDCLRRLRSLMEAVQSVSPPADPPNPAVAPARRGEDVYAIYRDSPADQYGMNELLDCIVDAGTSNEYKAEYGPSIICTYTRIGGWPCGIVANQRKLTKSANVGAQMPAVIYHESADKAARFIMDCNQKRLPIIFVNDTTGFMVGRDSEQSGIIRSGAKMVNAMSNCVVPKIALIVGNSYGAGNYAMCGRAFDPFLTYGWPGAKFAVMGANQAAGVLAQIQLAALERRGEIVDEKERHEVLAAVKASYSEQADIRYGAARGWVDRLIAPHETRREMIDALRIASKCPIDREFKTGVLQV